MLLIWKTVLSLRWGNPSLNRTSSFIISERRTALEREIEEKRQGETLGRREEGEEAEIEEHKEGNTHHSQVVGDHVITHIFQLQTQGCNGNDRRRNARAEHLTDRFL